MMEHYLQLFWLAITAHTLFSIEVILAIIVIACLFFFKRQQPIEIASPVPERQREEIKKSAIIITSQDIRAIAGDDVLTTQLDLARAYIEIGKKKLAKKILDHVAQHGNLRQKQVAIRPSANSCEKWRYGT